MTMTTIKVKPNGRVRQPEAGYSVMPEDGAVVPNNRYYNRLADQGAVTIIDDPKTPASKPDDKTQTVDEKSTKGKHSSDKGGGATTETEPGGSGKRKAKEA